MCAPTCAAPEDVDMTCDSCVAGIQVILFADEPFLWDLAWFYFFSTCFQVSPVMSSFANNDFQVKFWFYLTGCFWPSFLQLLQNMNSGLNQPATLRRGHGRRRRRLRQYRLLRRYRRRRALH